MKITSITYGRAIQEKEYHLLHWSATIEPAEGESADEALAEVKRFVNTDVLATKRSIEERASQQQLLREAMQKDGVRDWDKAAIREWLAKEGVEPGDNYDRGDEPEEADE